MASNTSRSYSKSLRGYGRGVVGGLIFAFGPLYTMEIWWQGFTASPGVLLMSIAATYVVLVAYAFYAGLHSDRSILYNAAEALETIAIGFVVAFVVLKLLGQLPSDLSAKEFMSRLTIEGLTCAIGVAVGSAQLGKDPNSENEGGTPSGLNGFVHEIAYSVLGAVIIVAGFTPTMEIVVTALEATPLATLGTAVVSFLLALGVMSYFDFRGSDSGASGVYAGGPVGDAFVTYAIGLVLSAALLWSVGRFDGVGLGAALSMIVYLAWPATLGASVGRLLL